MTAAPQLAIIGAGIGGLALAGLLARKGARVRLYEQAQQFERIGAGIQMSPNATRVLAALGLEPRLRALGFARVRDDGAGRAVFRRRAAPDQSTPKAGLVATPFAALAALAKPNSAAKRRARRAKARRSRAAGRAAS